ncbi:unnamed protein product [Musa acuminata var. zebrina]
MTFLSSCYVSSACSGSSKLAPAVVISAGDELWVARYILEVITANLTVDIVITEIAGVVLSFDPKPIQGDWNGAGAHTNYCTKSMRCDGYGEGNERRLTGRHETADINTFLWVRCFLVRSNLCSSHNGFVMWISSGYFEDRRPTSNKDPYVVTSMIAETTILWNP